LTQPSRELDHIATARTTPLMAAANSTFHLTTALWEPNSSSE
jgi:hypothetical protein